MDVKIGTYLAEETTPCNATFQYIRISTKGGRCAVTIFFWLPVFFLVTVPFRLKGRPLQATASSLFRALVPLLTTGPRMLLRSTE